MHTLIGDPNTHYHDAANGMMHSKTFESFSIRDDGRVYVAWLDSRGQQNGGYTTGHVLMQYSDTHGDSVANSVSVKQSWSTSATDICSKTTGETFVNTEM